MGELIPMGKVERPSKVFTDEVKAAIALANQVTRELRKYGCTVVGSAIDHDQPFLIVECHQPLHMVRVGRCQISLAPTPGHFIKCRTYLLGCLIEWQVKPLPAPVSELIGSVH